MTKVRVAINGFGRIGRLFFRAAFESPNIEIIAINDLGDVENLAYLLKYDTVYGRYAKEIKADAATGTLIVDGVAIKFLQVKSSINTANIYQLNDEWFWVFIYDINDMNIIGSGRSWKCDQLEGLVTLLKDNIN